MRFLLFVAALSGCTQDFDAFLGDASSPADATSTDAAKDATPQDGSGGDAGLAFGCGAQTIPDCSQCNGMTQPCVYCGAGNSLAGKCIQQGTSCTFNAPSGFQVCSCQNASACPESYEVCRNGTCRTCTDSNNNAGQSCKGGGTCAPTDGGCI